jgi:AraC-like DNA-binding protein/mannose-6-phosphate isomerase-like protein (cupin superfamily)
MSFMRQGHILRDFDPGRGVSIATLAYEYPSGFLVPEHAHGSDQFIYATRGAMEVHSDQSMWLIPPSFALWVPARVRHRIRMPAAVSMRTLYLRPGLVQRADSSCVVLSVSPLLRELVVETVRVGKLRLRTPEQCTLRDLTVLHIGRATAIPTETRMPRESRALAVAMRILDSLSQSPSLQTLCSDVGVSTRTLQRLFRKNVGVDVDSWRRQVRLTRAVELLLAGDSVKQVAFSVGYNQPSAFVAAFRRTFGFTPKAWVERVSKA